MAYTPLQDGTQAFAIGSSPVTINSVAYIAEDIQIQHPSTVKEIKDSNAIPTGQVLIPENSTGTMKLQLATAATAVPARNQSFTLYGVLWYVKDVGEAYTQGDYVKINVSFVRSINS